MQRYIIKNNAPVSPPVCGVTAKGRVISNFAGRVKNDAAFAAENGYYPLAKREVGGDLLEGNELCGRGTYVLVAGEWVFKRK